MVAWRTDGHGNQNADQVSGLYVCDGKIRAKVGTTAEIGARNDNREQR